MRTGYQIENGYFYIICESENHELVEQLLDEGFEVPEFYHLLDGGCRIAIRLPDPRKTYLKMQNTRGDRK